jgi:hypothetical protein
MTLNPRNKALRRQTARDIPRGGIYSEPQN